MCIHVLGEGSMSMFGLLRRYVCSIPGLICFHLAEVLYNRMMNLLTCVGFLAALQGAACFQHWLFKKVGTKDMYSASVFHFLLTPVQAKNFKELFFTRVVKQLFMILTFPNSFLSCAIRSGLYARGAIGGVVHLVPHGYSYREGARVALSHEQEETC